MPRNREIKFEDCFNLPNPGLRSYFGNVRSGQPEEYRTPFAKDQPITKVLDDWMQELEQIAKEWPTLWEYEKDLAKKVGPMSVMKPLKDRMADIDAYYEGILLPSKPISDSAINATVSEWSRIRGLQIRRQSRTIDNMKLSTNSGSPYFTKRRNVLGKTRFCQVLGRSGEYVQYLGMKRYVYPSDLTNYQTAWRAAAILGWRGQEGGPSIDDVKQRVVWMFPFAVNVMELMAYQPLIESAQAFDLVPAWVSMESVDVRITQMFDTKKPDDLVICTDFSKFDQHFNKHMQTAAKSIIAQLFTPNRATSYWLDWIFPIKYDIPLAYDWDKIRSGPHGMASGSGGTNADETLAHRALQYEAAINDRSRLNPYSQCLGDDGVLTYPGITVDSVMRSYTAHGQEMNEDKQYASTQDCTYLRRWHHREYRKDGLCVGVYSTCRALGRLMEQERYFDPEEWGPKAVALRQLSILENVKWHPLREAFVEFCMKRDKYRLGIDIPHFLDNIDEEAQRMIEFIPDFLGYTKTMQMPSDQQHVSGISDWWIVKYLKSRD